MQSDVDWPNAWVGDRVHGHAAVRAYWTRQFAVLDPRLEIRGLSQDVPDRVIARVHQIMRDQAGKVIDD